MNAPLAPPGDHPDVVPLAELSARGIHAPSVQSLARDQSPFARPTVWTRHLAPGVVLPPTRSTSATAASPTPIPSPSTWTAACASPSPPRAASICAASSPARRRRGLRRLRLHLRRPRLPAAEPCLDLAVRDHHAASLPTVTKPPSSSTTAARSYALWPPPAPSPSPPPAYLDRLQRPSAPGPARHLIVYGAANCRIRYHDDPRTGFRRDVDPAANTTPRDPAVLDCTVAPTPAGARITAVSPGGGADLFADAYVLRSHRPWPDHLVPGAPVDVTALDTFATSDVGSALSLGPSAADAAAGLAAAWDQSLGTSPFRPGVRYARTLLALAGGI